MLFRLSILYRNLRIILFVVTTASLVGLYQPPPDQPQEPPSNPTTADRNIQTISGLEQARAIATQSKIEMGNQFLILNT